MNIEELKKLLIKSDVPNYLYNLNGSGRKDERFCIESCDNEWLVYFSEKGIRTTEKRFHSEDDACMFLYEQLKNL